MIGRLLTALLIASPSVAAPLATFEEPALAGVVSGSGGGPVFGACTTSDAAAPVDQPGRGEVIATPAALGGVDAADRVLLLSTAPAEGEDRLAQSRWELVFEAREPSLLRLRMAFVTRDLQAMGDWWTLLLDGQPFACGDARHVEALIPSVLSPDDWATPWMDLGEGLPVDPGVHVLHVIVGDGTDSAGASAVLLDDVVLAAGQPPPTPCRPAPPEDVGEVAFMPGSNPERWTFDDNRFCSGGPQLSCARCLSGAPSAGPPNPCPPGDVLVDPNGGFVDSSFQSFEMYIVADCGREMHLPLYDVESGCISIFDESRFPVGITVTNNAGFLASGGEVCWNATDCNPGPPPDNDPGGPGNERVMDVYFRAEPALCGVYIINFRSWAGCIWDLYANCDGQGSEGFRIYDDFCTAQAAVNLLPEIVLQPLQLSSGIGCFVDYCVVVENIGCRTAGPFTVRVENGTDVNTHVLTLGPGFESTLCGTLDVADSGSPTTTTTVTARADFGNVVLECTENPGASACDPAPGADVRTSSTNVGCNQSPTCNAGGPYSGSCGAGGVRTILLDGTGSSDPDGGPLAYAWTTNCPGATITGPTLSRPTLVVPNGTCTSCTVTLTVTDSAGVSATCSAPVQLADALPPVLSCPTNTTVQCAGPGAHDAAKAAWLASATATDACAGSRPVTATLVSSVVLCPGSVFETWRFSATDTCGNTATCDRQWNENDFQPPVVTPPPPRTLSCPASPAALSQWQALATASDACAGPLPVTATLQGEVRPCPQTVIQTWLFTAVDPCGNQGTATSTFEVRDDAPPALHGVPADATVSCDAVPPPAAVSATDTCDPSPIVTMTSAETSLGCPADRLVVRTWTARDACGNVTVATQRLTVRDTAPPTLQGVPADATVSCPSVPPPAPVTASDNCDMAPVVTLAESVEPGACPQERVVVRTWTARDACNNASSATQRITVVDDVAPVLAGVPADGTVSCDAIPPPASPTASDACDPAPTVTFAQAQEPGACPQERVLVRTWTARDACGNVSTATQRLTVVDDAAPVLAGVPADATVSCDAIPPPASPTASDACDPAPTVTLAESVEPGGCPQERVLVRTWTARDACQNQSSRTQRLTVVDDAPPSMAGVPADATVSCDAVPAPAAVSATDACDPAPSVTMTETVTPGACPQESLRVRTWTARDACGNVSTAAQRLTVVDDAAPTLSGVPPDATVSCAAVPSPAAVGATDTCDPSPLVTFTETIVPSTNGSAARTRRTPTRGPVTLGAGCPDEYQIQRTWVARDACGNESTATQVLTVVDTGMPVLSGVPGNVTVSCDAVPPPASVTATDDCDPAPGVAFVQTRFDGPCPHSYELRRDWTATDRCGNQSAQQQVVTVVDTTPPVLVAPADLTVECPAPASGPQSESAWLASATATDGCGVATVHVTELSRTPGCGATYVAVFELWAEDECGLQSPHVQRTYTVQDTTPPVLSPPADTTQECPAPAAGPQSEAGWLASASATDGCGVATVHVAELSRTPGCGATYVAVFELWAEDACGLQSPHVQRTYLVQDTTPPVLAPPADLTVECPAAPSGPQSESAWLASATASDGCGGPVVRSRELSRTPGCGATYVAVFELWAEDDCGNESDRVERTYSVVDTTPPALSAPASLVVECPAPGSGPGSEAAWAESATASDACGPATASWREVLREPGCGATYAVTYEFWATDDCGNESAREQRRYVVVDTTPPAFAGGDPAFRFSIWPPNHGYVVYGTNDVVSASDACGDVVVRATGCRSSQPEEVHQGSTPDGGNGDGRFAEDCVVSVDGTQFAVRAERLGACGPGSARTYTIEFTATDECGNASPAAGTIVVEHDRSNHQDVNRGRKLGPNDPPPFPYLHPTVYGTGCGP